MHNRLGNKKKRRSPRYALFAIIGGTWILISIVLLLNKSISESLFDGLPEAGHCSSCTSAGLVTIGAPLLLFFIGGLGIAYDAIRFEKLTKSNNQKTRLVVAALAIAIASTIIYLWANLFVNGLY